MSTADWRYLLMMDENRQAIAPNGLRVAIYRDSFGHMIIRETVSHLTVVDALDFVDAWAYLNNNGFVVLEGE